ncbi:MAG: hypothetical protein ACOYMQ_16635 [Pseudanabaena sp.]
MTIDKSRRGIAFPQPSINFKIPLIWECFAHNLTTQGQFIGESEEGSAFANKYGRGEFANCGANAKPLHP